MTDEWEELEKEDEEDVYNQESREKQIDDDQIDGWQGAWMQGYEEGD